MEELGGIYVGDEEGREGIYLEEIYLEGGHSYLSGVYLSSKKHLAQRNRPEDHLSSHRIRPSKVSLQKPAQIQARKTVLYYLEKYRILTSFLGGSHMIPAFVVMECAVLGLEARRSGRL